MFERTTNVSIIMIIQFKFSIHGLIVTPFTDGECIIGAPKISNNFCDIKLSSCNIGLFSNIPCNVFVTTIVIV